MQSSVVSQYGMCAGGRGGGGGVGGVDTEKSVFFCLVNHAPALDSFFLMLD